MGCILYELLVGSPPFCTTSLLQLIRKIRYETVPWPTNLSVDCLNLLQGLLEKDSRRRLTWPTLLQHPFLENKVLLPPEKRTETRVHLISYRDNNLKVSMGGFTIIVIVSVGPRLPLTTALTASQELAKEIQRQDLSQRMPYKNKYDICYVILIDLNNLFKCCNRVFTRALQRLEEYERRRNSAPVAQPKPIIIANPAAAFQSTQYMTYFNIFNNKRNYILT